MKTATAWFDHYAESHQDKTNKLIHWICIPIILVTTLGLMQSIPFTVSAPPWLGFGTLFAAAALVFYFRLSWTLGVGMALISAIAIGINTAIVLAGLNLPAVSAGVFFVAWVFQFIGHKIEGKKPSFFEDLQFLLVGPAWLLQFIYKRVGIPVETRTSRAALA
jgi:uncharacterized membrane protein YGL010W